VYTHLTVRIKEVFLSTNGHVVAVVLAGRTTRVIISQEENTFYCRTNRKEEIKEYKQLNTLFKRLPAGFRVWPVLYVVGVLFRSIGQLSNSNKIETLQHLFVPLRHTDFKRVS